MANTTTGQPLFQSAPEARRNVGIILVPTMLALMVPVGKQLSTSAPNVPKRVSCEQLGRPLTLGIPAPLWAPFAGLSASSPQVRFQASVDGVGNTLPLSVVVTLPPGKQLFESAPQSRRNLDYRVRENPLLLASSVAQAPVGAQRFESAPRGRAVGVDQAPNLLPLVTALPTGLQRAESAPATRVAVQVDLPPNRVLGSVPTIPQLGQTLVARSGLLVDVYPNLVGTTLGIGTPPVGALFASAPQARYDLAPRVFPFPNILLGIVTAGPIPPGLQQLTVAGQPKVNIVAWDVPQNSLALQLPPDPLPVLTRRAGKVQTPKKHKPPEVVTEESLYLVEDVGRSDELPTPDKSVPPLEVSLPPPLAVVVPVRVDQDQEAVEAFLAFLMMQDDDD